jgi:nucleotide-binding universal stress UspA family protein
LADGLRQYGVKVDSPIMPPGGADAADTLLKAAHDTGSDLLVMGAYGHGRLRELVFGGFTRQVLQTSSLPVLMLH